MFITLGLTFFSGEAYAQAKEPFPHGEDWVGSDYGQSDPWFSASAVMAYRKAPNTTWIPPIYHAVYGLDGRLHFNPRLAIVSGILWGGYNKLALEGEQGTPMSGATTMQSSEDINQEFSSFIFHVGADFGLLETKYVHIQAGPRLGVHTQEARLVGNELMINRLDDIKASSTNLHLGAVGTVGVFVLPFIEIGVQLQGDYGIGGDGSGSGHQVGGYTTTHL